MRRVRRVLVLMALGVIGLIGYRLIIGEITLPDAGIRSLAVLGVVIAVLKALRMVVGVWADGLERASFGSVDDPSIDDIEPIALRRQD